MSETDTIHYSQIRNFRYEEYFQKLQYNGKVINDEERKELIKFLDESISIYSESLIGLENISVGCKGIIDDLHNPFKTTLSIYWFIVITSIDCLVISKYFLLANTDYEKRFMRGKMKVILNEGFKKLYGFDEKTQKKSEWNKLGGVIENLPLSFQSQYRELSDLLDIHSKSSSWWKKERDSETHLNAERLYESRCEEIIEGKVMMDAMMLFRTLFAIHFFMTDVHDTLIRDYKNQEVKKN